ncbi:methionine ABC transporter substrate-binding protein [Halalkalibacillus sediminis]|uniref:Methionine ABC transporter substrate-binding protein n=1 Tax=Halalkalibacillus sediminis TaxID=2018042 RepID=A0A2I0QUQ0_9BACI|nr:MetQ/NlpA family ABC transporter substrate-binding protein [Halalkalibacillus sediminis]PKR78075.1 methionine ABC transporter substrate-binding protein [Halalkalibacillus sediminis]
MKKLLAILLATLLIGFLAACGTADEEDSSNGDSEGSEESTEEETDSEDTESGEGENSEAEGETTELVIGAANVPHSEILEEAKPLLKEEGIEIQIEVYQDYVLPNEDLDNGTLDANFFQHIPYLEDQKEEIGYDFVSLGGVHIEPMGIYSQNISSADDVEDGTNVIMSRSEADHGRILSILQEAGLITLEEGVDPVAATVDDIAENPKNLEFDASIDAGLLPEFYERESDALVAINTNYAIEAGLVPTEDAVFLEGSDSPYANVIATTADNEGNEALHTLVEVLRTDEIQNFMEEEYEGAIVPVDE